MDLEPLLPPHEVQVAALLASHSGTPFSARDIADRLPGTTLRFVRDVLAQMDGMAILMPGGTDAEPTWTWPRNAGKRSPAYLKQLRDSANRHGLEWPAA